MHFRPRPRYPVQTVLAVLAFLLVAAASPAPAAPDAPGSKDHPEVKRVTGSQIIFYKFNAFDEMNLPLEPVSKANGKFKDTRRERVEGAHTVLYYLMPPDSSPLEAVSQYGGELKGSRGFENLWMPDGETPVSNDNAGFAERTYADLKAINLDYFHLFNPNGKRYGSFKGKSAKGGDLYVSVYAFTITDDTGTAVGKFEKVAKLVKGQTVARVDIIETKPMTARMTVVKAAEITDAVAKTGRVAIYGVYFDTDKADLKPESQPALVEIAQAIKAAGPGRQFLIVGHTDNQGAYEYNQTLSARRARAVTEAVIRDHGLPAASVVPVGVGMAAPVAANTDEAGRAKNRRVEIVAM